MISNGIKKLKIGLLVAVLSLAVGVGSANAADLTYSSDTPVLLTTPNYTVTIKSGSEATSVVVSGSSFRVVVPTSSTFTVASTQNMDLTLEAGTGSNANTCSGTTNTTVITSTAAADYTITPNGGVCAASSGGGGGGGSSTTTTTVAATPATPAVPATPGNVIVGCGNRTSGFSTSSGLSCVGNTSTIPATPATPATPASASSTASSTGASTYNFGATTLKNGSKGEAVKELQRFLNAKLNLGLVIDGALGPKTIAVIKQWQSDNGLVADGLIGAKTKAMMNAEAGTTTTPATTSTPSTTATSYNFGATTLKNGSKGEAVKELQRFLNAKLNLGLAIDGALGPKTIAVIKQWQSDNGLVADGLIGAKTKAMMNEQAAQ